MTELQGIELDASSFDITVRGATRPVLIEFWATWCGTCRLLAPTILRLSQEWCDRLDVFVVDVATAPEVATKHNIMSLPTIVLFLDGREIKRIVGMRSYTHLIAELKDCL